MVSKKNDLCLQLLAPIKKNIKEKGSDLLMFANSHNYLRFVRLYPLEMNFQLHEEIYIPTRLFFKTFIYFL